MRKTYRFLNLRKLCDSGEKEKKNKSIILDSGKCHEKNKMGLCEVMTYGRRFKNLIGWSEKATLRM